MSRFYKNEYLFSEAYLQELTQIEEDSAVRACLNTLTEYREYADTSTLTAWNQSFVHEMLQALEFGVRSEDEHIALLYQLGSPDQIVSLCYSLLPTEDPDNTRIGQNWAERIIRQLRTKGLHWGILTNGERIVSFKFRWIFFNSEFEQRPFTKKAESMLELHRQFYRGIDNFINFVETNYNPKKLSTKFQKFYTLSFSEVLQELQKQKVSLTSEDEATVRDTYDRIRALHGEITRTDREIDRMVYDLYRLTEEEIRIVEREGELGIRN